MHCLFELFLVKSSISVVVCDLEFLVDARDTSGSSLGKSLPKVEEELLFVGVGINVLYLSLLGENSSVTAEKVR
jgi:hypothetical protein